MILHLQMLEGIVFYDIVRMHFVAGEDQGVKVKINAWRYEGEDLRHKDMEIFLLRKTRFSCDSQISFSMFLDHFNFNIINLYFLYIRGPYF